MAAGTNKYLQLPISRVKTIMKSSPQVESISSESIHLVAKATELFIQYLARESIERSENSNELQYGDVAEIVNCDNKLEFLRELIPPKITIREYKSMLVKDNSNSLFNTDLV